MANKYLDSSSKAGLPTSKDNSEKLLVYALDPMCSWCYGFKAVRDELFSQLEGEIDIVWLVGGLAPDSYVPMEASMRQSLQETWRRIEQRVPGTKFNFDFWTQNTPRRSTYPACRAVLTAGVMAEPDRKRATMNAVNDAIQSAYYQKAQNPSDDETLIAAASAIGLNTTEFKTLLNSDEIHQLHAEHRDQCAQLSIQSYPSLRLINEGQLVDIPIDYNDAAPMLDAIRSKNPT